MLPARAALISIASHPPVTVQSTFVEVVAKSASIAAWNVHINGRAGCSTTVAFDSPSFTPCLVMSLSSTFENRCINFTAVKAVSDIMVMHPNAA